MSQARPIAVVTGTSTGFGNLIARDLARTGYHTFATMRETSSRNAKAKAELEALGIVVLEVDVTDDASVEAAGRTVAASGAVAVLVNNAGSGFMGITEAFTSAAAMKQFDTNVFSTIRVNRAFLPAMRAAKRGLVVYVSSVVGRVVIPFTGLYAASKFALESLAETTSYELRPFGIDVAIVEPGAYATNISSTIVVPDDDARVASYGDVAKIADAIFSGLGESAGDPQEVADAILALAQMPTGKRPLRTVVGGNAAVSAINAAAAPLQREYLQSLGLGDLLPREIAHA